MDYLWLFITIGAVMIKQGLATFPPTLPHGHNLTQEHLNIATIRDVLETVSKMWHEYGVLHAKNVELEKTLAVLGEHLKGSNDTCDLLRQNALAERSCYNRSNHWVMCKLDICEKESRTYSNIIGGLLAQLTSGILRPEAEGDSSSNITEVIALSAKRAADEVNTLRRKIHEENQCATFLGDENNEKLNFQHIHEKNAANEMIEERGNESDATGENVQTANSETP